MKKVVMVGGIVFISLMMILISIPFIFRGALLEKTRTAINRDLNVNIEFKDLRISLIKDFPKASLMLSQVLVTGKAEFAGDTLLSVQSLRTSFGLFDLFTPDDLTISEIILNNADLRLRVNENNLVNWQIFPESQESAQETTGSEPGTFGMQLSKIEINDSRVSYIDVTLPLQVDLTGIEMDISGRMYGSETKLTAEGTSEQFNLVYDGTSYISKTRLGLKSLLDIHFDAMDFRFSEGEVMVNNLPLDLQGSFSMPGDTINFDLGFASRASTLGEILALVPPGYEAYLKDLSATGSASFTGSFKGFYYEETYPALQIDLSLANGNARYASMPDEIRNISGNLAINKPQGDFNLTSLTISKAHFEIRNNPVDLNLQLSNLLEDMHFDGKLVGRINFDHLKDAIPVDSLQLAGLLDVNLGVNGNYSAIENKKYELIKTAGAIILNNFEIRSRDLTQPVGVSSGVLDFAPDRIQLKQMDVRIGQSDMALSGAVADYYPYLFSGGTLRGNVLLNSNYLNLNELMQLQVEDTASVQTIVSSKGGNTAARPGSLEQESSPTSFQVPEKINLMVQADIKRALYDNLNINNIQGSVGINDGKLDLNGVRMNLMEGEMKLAGSYANTPEKMPDVNMTIDMISFDIPTAFQSLGLVRNYLPIAAQSKGRFSTTLNLKGQLDENMKLNLASLNGSGLFQSFNVQILNSPVFNKIKSVLNEEKLRDMRIDDFTANFSIENGNLVLRPFETRLAGQQAVFAGQLSAQNLISMQIGFLISRDALSKSVENTIGILPGQQNIKFIPVGVMINGPVGDPDVKVDLSDARDLVKQEVRNASKEELQKTINKLGDGLRKLLK